MNRRIPNGTYGGVGGRRLAASSYPINLYSYEIATLPLVARNDNLRIFFTPCTLIPSLWDKL
jgi:hypothetical protein